MNAQNGTTDPRLAASKRPRPRRDLEPIPPREIIGNQQVRKLCGNITRHTLIRWRNLDTNPFPEPIRTLPGTPITELWDRREVRAWLKLNRPPQE